MPPADSVTKDSRSARTKDCLTDLELTNGCDALGSGEAGRGAGDLEFSGEMLWCSK